MQTSNTKINAIYYNDTHGQISNIDGFLSARKEFYAKNNGLNLTLSGGDVFLDTSKHNDITAQKLITQTDAIGLGNHDIEGGIDYLKRLIDRFKIRGKLLASNFHSLKDNENETIPKSKIIERNGIKVGIIGVAPLDFKKLAFLTPRNKDIEISNIDKTIKEVKEEVRRLEKQGINKIFLLAHTGENGNNGENYYETFAKIGGIDVVIGGHDHKEVEKLLFSDRGEPVFIVSTGRNPNNNGFEENLNIFGELNLEFDKNGVLVAEKCKNNFIKTPEAKQVSSSKKQYICTLDAPLVRTNWSVGHSEIGNLIADSNLWYVNKYTKGEKADFAFVNSGTIRNNFDEKEITEEQVISALPFTVSKLIKTRLSKKQIINTLSWCALSTSFAKVSPGVMQVSGMEYTINPDLSVSDVHILNNDGSIKYDLDDFEDDDTFPCVYDVFLATGVAGLKEMKKDEDDESVEHFDTSRQEALFEYLSKQKHISNYKQIRIHTT